MIQIDCPWCGPRSEIEFRCAGPHEKRPDPASASDVEWTDYLYFRDNTRGLLLEHWVHAFGCRQWIAVERDTVTNAIAGTTPVDAKSVSA